MFSTPQNVPSTQPTAPGKRKRLDEEEAARVRPALLNDDMKDRQILETDATPVNNPIPPIPSPDHAIDIMEPDEDVAAPDEDLPNQTDVPPPPQGAKPTTPPASGMPFTSAIFPRTVIPYHALLGNINDETTSAIENNPEAFLAIIPYGGGKRLMEENPSLDKDIESFIRSLGYKDSERIRVIAPRSKYPPVNDFGKPYTLLLTNPPDNLAAYLTYQQTFSFKICKGQKKVAFHALPFDKSTRSWIITDISGSFVSDDDYARASALATIRNKLNRDRNYRNIVDRCYAARASPLDINGRVEDSLKSFHLNTVKLQQNGKEDRVVWQMMAHPISPNRDIYEEWVNAIRNVSYLVDHIFPLDTHRVIFRCEFCKNETHPYYMCPFPRAKGWEGPIPEDVLRTRENDRRRLYDGPRGDRGGRGTRGRGFNTSNSPRRGIYGR